MRQLVLITGVSGAGKSVALKALEDAGYYCVDNLPAPVLPGLVEHLESSEIDRVAVAIDARSGQSIGELPGIVKQLRATDEAGRSQREVRVLFLTSSTAKLVQRFSETRRRHPLSPAYTGTQTMPAEPTPSLIEAIEHERDLVLSLAEIGQVIDTSTLSTALLRESVREFIGQPVTGMTLMFESFGFKRGIPLDADLVFDLRCLPNPFYDLELRPLTGRDQPVVQFLEAIPDARRMVDDIERFVHDWLPSYVRDHRSYLTVAVGCTGGQHRSVWASETLAARLRAQGASAITRHRELD